MCNADPKKPRPKFQDYLLPWDTPPKPEQTQEDIISILQTIGNAMKAD